MTVARMNACLNSIAEWERWEVKFGLKKPHLMVITISQENVFFSSESRQYSLKLEDKIYAFVMTYDRKLT